MHTESELKKLIETIETSTVNPLYYFSQQWLLKDAIKYFEDSEIIVVDNKGDMWQRGKKLKEKYGVAL